MKSDFVYLKFSIANVSKSQLRINGLGRLYGLRIYINGLQHIQPLKHFSIFLFTAIFRPIRLPYILLWVCQMDLIFR